MNATLGSIYARIQVSHLGNAVQKKGKLARLRNIDMKKNKEGNMMGAVPNLLAPPRMEGALSKTHSR
jgi:hypothetical protein